MTQRETVLALLREHPEGCCVTDFDREQMGLGYAARNRISTLRKEGLPILSAPCRKHAHKSQTTARYTLVVQPVQLQMSAL